MKLETTLKLGIGGILIAACGLGAWAFWPEEPKRDVSVRALDDAPAVAAAERAVVHASVRPSGEQGKVARDRPLDQAEPDAADSENSLLVETDMAALEASQWMEERYEQAYVYTGTALSKQEQNAKKGIFSEEMLRAREDELVRANPDMKEAIEAERLARQKELDRYRKSGGLSVEDEAIQKGIQLED